ncbi:LCM-domain-containing protein [Penicillium angulare]|uniref:LCM-domain-containing protein n=1 Tax=Penicillium angulare TaxID=116970 RepID=UPI0025405B72|nr:LCM-domain-containing protein [Penicillium angulare]KAJ5279392.1 LCM-domain-containing protein [Penicillium angulare]
MAPPARPAVAVATKAEKDADVVMGTNNSSIASKRSVEMIYYPQPHFFRYFVKKPQRRSPIINRGYWLRMHAMAETVRQFIAKAPTDKPKFILNLGCGYDPLPFMLLSDEQKSMRSEQAVFVDIDYEKLMVHKKNAIRQTEEITNVLGDVEFGSDEDAIQIKSSRYRAVGCDLKNIKKLDDVLHKSILPSTDCSVLFLAEVSLTYMDVQSANEVVKWASKLTNDVQFCILEQFFPDGPEHPFAKTMMTHFNKLRAPLFSIHEFPSLAEQEQRFRNAGWPQAKARTLWDLWSDSTFLSDSLRNGLDAYEAFDEWEEFALFASHYFLLVASNNPESSEGTENILNTTENLGTPNISSKFVLRPHCPVEKRGRRRYGALVPGGKDNESLSYHGGQGEQTRLSSTDIYTPENVGESKSIPPSRDIPTRMCHTITSLDDTTDSCILIGGRTSPATPLNDCWLRRDNTWQQVHPLPEPRFRHNATNILIGEQGSVLVYGGKGNENTILDSWLLWNHKDEQGWQKVKTVGSNPEARFGASFTRITDSFGVLSGGIGSNGTILEDFWTWSLSRCDDGSLQVELVDLTQSVKKSSPHCFPYLSRFGATANASSMGLVFAGGIIPRQLIPANMEILLLDTDEILELSKMTKPCSETLISAIGLGPAFTGPRPLLTGHVANTINSDKLLILGGGAVCFSFGTFWTEGTWTLQPQESTIDNSWTLVVPKKEAPSTTTTTSPPSANKARRLVNKKSKKIVQIPRARIESAAQFQQILAGGKPVVIEKSDIGPCTDLWTKEYLTNSVGPDRKVVIHEAQSESMNFQSKNFSYVTKDFGTFLDEVHAGGRQYLRSISAESPSKQAASLETDFPSLRQDFRLPEYMAQVSENAHSSPLRISGPVTMWLHYDVMANVLCQIRGQRRLILFPPDDVQSLHIPPGTSSSTMTIFQTVGLDTPTAIPGTSPHEAILQPGEILFIPPLWLHTACSATSEVSVAVNVFFRNLTKGYASGRDVYGNRDLHAYEKSRGDLQRILRSFEGVPPDMARFYLRRLAQELQDVADE